MTGRLAAGLKRPWFLAGGLNCENIGRALQAAAPWGVDVSSGVETAGKKDGEKIACFVSLVRRGKRE